MDKGKVITELSKDLGIKRTANDQYTRQMLADKIHELLNSDFQRLISILYRMDVSESRLKLLLKENPDTDAGIIIADLMIERQLQKLRSRQQYKPDENISEDEKW